MFGLNYTKICEQMMKYNRQIFLHGTFHVDFSIDFGEIQTESNGPFFMFL